MEVELKLHEIMVNFGNFWNMHCGVNLTRYFQSMLQQILKICWNEKERESKNDLKKVICRVPPYLALGKRWFCRVPSEPALGKSVVCLFLKMALTSAGSRALGKPDPALGKSSRTAKTYPNRPSLAHTPHTTQACSPVHRRPPACAAAACPPALQSLEIR